MRELRRHSIELKAEAVKMVLEQGLTQQETGKRLSIPKGNIGNLVSAAKAALGNGSPGEQSVGALAAENARLRKELAEARMEREIFKKSHRVLRKGVTGRYAFTKAYRLLYPVKIRFIREFRGIQQSVHPESLEESK